MTKVCVPKTPTIDTDAVRQGDDCAAVDRLLAGAREARGGALRLHGEAGVGKSALLDYAAEIVRLVAEGATNQQVGPVAGRLARFVMTMPAMVGRASKVISPYVSSAIPMSDRAMAMGRCPFGSNQCAGTARYVHDLLWLCAVLPFFTPHPRKEGS